MFKQVSTIFFTSLSGKIFGFAKILLLVNIYGSNALTDTLIVVISICWFWSSIIIYSLFSVSLIPSLAKIKGTKEQLALTVNTLKSANILNIIFVIIILLKPELIISIFAPSSDAEFISYTSKLLQLLSPLLFLMSVTEMFTILNQYKAKMFISSLNMTVWNVFQIIALLIIFYSDNKEELNLIYTFALFTLIGYFLTAYMQLRVSLFFKYFSLINLFKIDLMNSVKLAKVNAFFFLSSLLTQLNVYIDNFFIAGLESGFISTYNIIVKVPELAQSLLISAIVIVFFNKIVKDTSNALKWFYRVLLILSPFFIIGQAFLYFFGSDILELIYSADALNRVSPMEITKILMIITSNVFLMIAVSLLVKISVTFGTSKSLLLASFFCVTFNVVGNYILIPLLGLIGVSISTLIATSTLFILILTYNQFHANRMKNSRRSNECAE